jgi:hypothetical protein
MNICKYKNIFGAPNTGVHSYKIFNVAIVDVILTVVLAKIIEKSRVTHYTFNQILLILFLLGIILHRLFCVRTTIDKILFK